MPNDQHLTGTSDLVECTAHFGGTKWLARERLQFRPSVYALVIHEDQLLVVTRRRTGKYFLPGGGVELGERMESALRREVKEETGIEIAVGSLVGFRESFYYYDPEDMGFHALLFFYQCIPKIFDLLSDEQVNDAADGNPHWVDITALKAQSFQDHGELMINLITRERS